MSKFFNLTTAEFPKKYSPEVESAIAAMGQAYEQAHTAQANGVSAQTIESLQNMARSRRSAAIALTVKEETDRLLKDLGGGVFVSRVAELLGLAASVKDPARGIVADRIDADDVIADLCAVPDKLLDIARQAAEKRFPPFRPKA